MVRAANSKVLSVIQRGPSERQVQVQEPGIDHSNLKQRCWYAVKCKPRQERMVSTNLHRAGIPIFFPQIQESRRIRPKLMGMEPLFPSYLFARFDVRSEYRIVKYARGVHGIVSFGMSPAVIEDELIQAIQERLDEQLANSIKPFSAGQVVKILNGPLHGMEAIFERPTPPYQRAVLLLRTISFRAKLVVDLENIVNL